MILPAGSRISYSISSLWTGCLSTVKGSELPCCGEQAASKVVEKSSKGSVRCCAQSSAPSCSADMGFTENLPPVPMLTRVPLSPAAPWQGWVSTYGRAFLACSFAPIVHADSVTRLVSQGSVITKYLMRRGDCRSQAEMAPYCWAYGRT